MRQNRISVTAKRARDRDMRNTARQRAKQQLTNSPQKQTPQQRVKVSEIFDLDAEDLEAEGSEIYLQHCTLKNPNQVKK